MRRGWLERIATPLAAAIVAGILAVFGSFWATTIANKTATDNLRASFAEQRAQVERDKRGDAYLKFLGTTAGFARALVTTHDQCASERTAGCDSARVDLQTKFSDLANAVNIVYIYGSSNANRLMGLILQLLPKIYETNESDFESYIRNGLDDSVLKPRLIAFQRNMCTELPANPRGDC